MKLRTLILIAALGLAACDPRLTPASNLSPREIQALAGVWEGRGTLRSGDADCPSVYLWTLRVGGGNVEGEAVDADRPHASPSRFTTFIDYDGTVRALARPGGRDTAVTGTFYRDRFAGDARNASCSYVLRLTRTGT